MGEPRAFCQLNDGVAGRRLESSGPRPDDQPSIQSDHDEPGDGGAPFVAVSQIGVYESREVFDLEVEGGEESLRAQFEQVGIFQGDKGLDFLLGESVVSADAPEDLEIEGPLAWRVGVRADPQGAAEHSR